MSNVIPFPQRPERERSPQPERANEPQRAAEPEPLWREAVGEELRIERQVRGERIADVAGRAGIAPQYLSEIERGRKDPSSEVLSAVTGALDLPMGALFTRVARRVGSATCFAA